MATLPPMPSTSSSSHHQHHYQRHQRHHSATTPLSSNNAPTQSSQLHQHQRQQASSPTNTPGHRPRSRQNTISSTHSSSSTLTKNPLKFIRLLHLQSPATYGGSSGSNTTHDSSSSSSSSSQSKRLNDPASSRAQQKQPQQQPEDHDLSQSAAQTHRRRHQHSHHLHAAAAKFREKVQQRGGFLSFLQSHYHALHTTNNSHHHHQQQQKTSPATSSLRESPSSPSTSSQDTFNQADGGNGAGGEQYHQQQQQRQHGYSTEPRGALRPPNGRSANQHLRNDHHYQQLPSGAHHLTASSSSSAHNPGQQLQPFPRERDQAAANNIALENDPLFVHHHPKSPRPLLSSSTSRTRRPSSNTILSSPSSPLSPPTSSPVSPASPVNSFMTIQSVKQLQQSSTPSSTPKHTLISSSHANGNNQPHPAYNLTISDFRVAQQFQRTLAASNPAQQNSDRTHQQLKKQHSSSRLQEKSGYLPLTLSTKIVGRLSERRNTMGNCVSDSKQHDDGDGSLSPLSPSPSSLLLHASLPSSPLLSPRSPSSASTPTTTLSSPPLLLDQHAHYKASLYELAQSRLDAVSPPGSHLHQHQQQTRMHRGEANGQYPLGTSKGEEEDEEEELQAKKGAQEGRRDHAAGDSLGVTKDKRHGVSQTSLDSDTLTTTSTATQCPLAQDAAATSSSSSSAGASLVPLSVTAAFKNIRKKPSMLLSFLKRRPSPSSSSTPAMPVPAHYLSLPIGGTITLSPSMPATPNGGVYNMCSEDLSSSEFAKLAGITILPDVDPDDEVEYYLNNEDQAQKTSISWQMPGSRHQQGNSSSSSSTGTVHRSMLSGLGLGAAGSATTSLHKATMLGAAAAAAAVAAGASSTSILSSATSTGGGREEIFDRERNATNYSLAASDTSRRKVNIWDPLFWTVPDKDNGDPTTTADAAATGQEGSQNVDTGEGRRDSHQQRQPTSSLSSTTMVLPPSASATSYFPTMPGTPTTTSSPIRAAMRDRSATTTQLLSSAPMSRSLPPSGAYLPRSHSSSSPPAPPHSLAGKHHHHQHCRHHNGMLSPPPTSRRHSSAVSPSSTAVYLSPSSPLTPTIHHRQLASSSQSSPTSSSLASPTSADISASSLSSVAETPQQVRKRLSSGRLTGGTSGSSNGVGSSSGKDTPTAITTTTSAVLLSHGPGRRKSFSSLTALAIELDHDEMATTGSDSSSNVNAATVEIKVVNPTPPAVSDMYYERKVHPLLPTSTESPGGGAVDELRRENGVSGMVRQQSSSGRLEGGGSRFQPVYPSSSSTSTRSSSRSRSRSRSRSPTPGVNTAGNKRSSPLSKEYHPNNTNAHHHHHHHHHLSRPSSSRSHNGHSRFELCTLDGTSLTDLKAFGGIGGDRLSPTAASFSIAASSAHSYNPPHHRSSLSHPFSLHHQSSSNGNSSGPRRYSHQNHLSPVSAHISPPTTTTLSSTTSTATSSSKAPTARYPNSHQRTLSLPSNTPQPLPVPTSSSSSHALENGYFHHHHHYHHRGHGLEQQSSSFQDRRLSSSRLLHPFDQPSSPPSAQSPTRATFASSSAPSSSRSSESTRQFMPGTKVGRFTLVEDKGTSSLDMEAVRLRRGSQLSTLSNNSIATITTTTGGLGEAQGGDRDSDLKVDPLRRPSSSLSTVSSMYLDPLDPTTTTGNLNQDDDDDSHARVLVDTEENCLVFQRKKRGPKRRVPATCSFTATAAATSAESPYSLQPQPDNSNIEHQLSSSLPSSFHLPPTSLIMATNDAGGRSSRSGSVGGMGRFDQFAPSSHP